MNTSIRYKLLLSMGGLLFGMLVMMTYLQVTSQRMLFERELNERIQLLQDNLHHRALWLLGQLKDQVEEDIASYNLFPLTQRLAERDADSDDVQYIILLDAEQRIVVHTASPDRVSSAYQVQDTRTHWLPGQQYPGYEDVRMDFLSELQLVEYRLPIRVGEQPWGHLVLGYSLQQLNRQIAASRRGHKATLQDLTLRTFGIALVVLLVSYWIISALSRRLTAPLVELTQFTEQLSNGDFSVPRPVVYSSEDEVGELTRRFTDMAAKLHESYTQLENYNQTLEQRVAERTEQLRSKNSELVSAMSELEASQQQLVHAEKMAALGSLIAGVAHEINTPLGAIQASVGNNQKSFKWFIEDLPVLFSGITPQEQALFSRLLSRAQRSLVASELSTKEERVLRRQLNRQLAERDVPQADTIAESLVEMKLADDVDELLPLLALPRAPMIVEQAHRLTGMGRSNETIRTAVARASKVVFALKHFAHHDHSGNMIMSDINTGIETVLVLYQNLLKQGCTLKAEYSTLPEVRCYPDELNQVWTNLIHNALYAMNLKGELTIKTGLEGDFVRVDIGDNGPGIPVDIQPRIFDSFFTTKPAGEGSGLGLGICRRIVDKHRGRIEVVSQPGKTVFSVWIPQHTDNDVNTSSVG